MKAGLIILVICLVLLGVFLIFYNFIVLTIEKLTFKKKTAKKIYQIAMDHDYYLLNEVAMKIGTHTIHFDHILFGNKYIYCIVTRHYNVGVNGNFEDASWFNYKINGKCKMMKNPLRLNRERVDYFATAITSSKDMFVGMLVVNDSCLVSTIKGAGESDLILNVKHLEKTIKDHENRNDVSVIDPKMLELLVKDIYGKCIKK